MIQINDVEIIYVRDGIILNYFKNYFKNNWKLFQPCDAIRVILRKRYIIMRVKKIICWRSSTAWKLSKYGAFSGPYFPIFGLNTERYGVSLRIQFEYGKIRTSKNSVFGHFTYSVEYISNSESSQLFSYIQ